MTKESAFAEIGNNIENRTDNMIINLIFKYSLSYSNMSNYVGFLRT